ncbi:MAG: YicC family protein [Clostridia bacterium]|nr:YicC family protein [Clostridia bacterium]
MFNSMTAFGRCRRNEEGRDITVELRSVNNRYLDCSVRLPRSYSALEERIKPYLQSRGISRGKVDVYIGVEVTESDDGAIMLDTGYAAGYIAALRQLRDTFSLTDDISVMSVAQNRELFRVQKPEDDIEGDWQRILPVLDSALDAFLAARGNEGARLHADIARKIENIKRNVDRISQMSRADIEGYRDKIEERIREILSDNRITVDENRLLTECAIAADRLAIDEELVRLLSHFDTFRDIAESSEPAGRKLDFLLQEMNREVNTVGSKCQNAAIAKLVVDCKSELEKIREQIQNIE